MVTTVSSKGQIVLPAQLRQQDRIEPGHQLEVERIDSGEDRPKRLAGRRNTGLVKLLLACPVRRWSTPLDRSESTDEVRVPSIG
jgi:AbrB family looped-hinge helix DNA binding protein